MPHFANTTRMLIAELKFVMAKAEAVAEVKFVVVVARVEVLATY